MPTLLSRPTTHPVARHDIVDEISRRNLLRLGAGTGAGLAVGVPVLAGCNSGGQPSDTSGATPPKTPTGVLRIANNGEPITLDPTLSSSYLDLGIVGNSVYESLLTFRGDTLELEGELAESFESTPDAREWTFRLNDGITFHDGEPLTSTAVRKSFEYYASGASPWAPLLPEKASYDDSDPRVLRITSPTPHPDMGRYAAFLSVLSPKLLASGEDAVNKKPTGTGPFTFVSYTTAKNVVLEANPDYRGPGPYLERLDFQIIPDASARASALRSGSIHLIRRMAVTDARPLRDDPRFAVVKKNVGITTYLWLFTEHPIVRNVNIRRAMAHAIDKTAIVNAIFDGETAELLDSVLPPGLHGYESPDTQYPYDVDRAKQLVAESGLPTPVQVECVWAPETGGSHDKVLNAISGMLEKVGITMKVTRKPWSPTVANAFKSGTKRDYDGFITDVGWGITGGPFLFATDLFRAPTQLDDPAFVELQRKVLTTPDGQKRQRAFADIQEYVNRQLPVISLYTEIALDAHQSTVRGYVTPKDGVQPLYRQVFLAS